MGVKRISYGITDYERMRKENFYYVDKTGFIKEIEKSPSFLFFIRPRRFGKSLLLNMMECYYDIERKEQFEELFSGTYVYENPTEERNKYFILKFNFSSVSSDIDEVESSFNETIRFAALKFLKKYKSYIDDKEEKMYEKVSTVETASSILKHIISYTEGKGKIYLLIDEYDNFTNTILSTQGRERYTAITHGEGFFRHFFNVIKTGTTDVNAAISKLFITGVSPVTMDDVTSGFNIGSNITTRPSFNETVGFTEKEVREMLTYYINEGLIQDSCDKLTGVIRGWYDNYLFSQDSSVKMYNSDMVLYFLSEYISRKKIPSDMLDHNVKIDYEKLRYLIITDLEGSRRANGNFEKLKIIIEKGEIISRLVSSFPVKRIIEPENFISLLYYFGLLTIKKEYRGKVLLTIPNEVIRTMFYEYIRECYRDTDIFNINFYKLDELFTDFAYEGKWEVLIDYLSSEMGKQTAVRDYIEGEKSIQTFLRVYLNFSNYYITRTEAELNLGYSDILMLPNIHSFPDMKYSYLFEIKYIKVSDYSESVLEGKIKEAKEGLNKYGTDPSLLKLTGSTKLIKAIIVFAGVEIKYREEL